VAGFSLRRSGRSIADADYPKLLRTQSIFINPVAGVADPGASRSFGNPISGVNDPGYNNSSTAPKGEPDRPVRFPLRAIASDNGNYFFAATGTGGNVASSCWKRVRVASSWASRRPRLASEVASAAAPARSFARAAV
jgi:hypothetical protein